MPTKKNTSDPQSGTGFGLPPDKQPVALIAGFNDGKQIDGMVEEADKLGWMILDETVIGRALPKNHIHIGIVLNHDREGAMTDYARRSGLPVVCCGRLVRDLANVATVWFSRGHVGRTVADYFHEKNFKHVAYIGNTPLRQPKYYAGLQARADELGILSHLLQIEFHDQLGKQRKFDRLVRLFGDWLCDLPKPVGFFAYNDWMAIRVLLICQQRGISVPHEVAILSQGGSKLCRTASIQISSIELDWGLKGRESVRLLHQMASGQPYENITLFPKGVIERHSSSVMAIDDPRVVKALGYMSEHLDWPLNAEDVAREIGVSGRTLERVFRMHLGRSVKQELRRQRLRLSIDLLRETDLSIAQICKKIGMPSRAYFHKSFRQVYDVTPRQFRLHR